MTSEQRPTSPGRFITNAAFLRYGHLFTDF